MYWVMDWYRAVKQKRAWKPRSKNNWDININNAFKNTSMQRGAERVNRVVSDYIERVSNSSEVKHNSASVSLECSNTLHHWNLTPLASAPRNNAYSGMRRMNSCKSQLLASKTSRRSDPTACRFALQIFEHDVFLFSDVQLRRFRSTYGRHNYESIWIRIELFLKKKFWDCRRRWI